MIKKQVHFFATRRDLEILLRAVEGEGNVQYCLAGLFDTSTVASLPSLLREKDLGTVSIGNAAHGQKYLIAHRNEAIAVRTVPQRRGGIKYAIDQLANPGTIVFRPGGIYKSGILISSEVGTVSENSNSTDLFSMFNKNIKQQFMKVQSFYVGIDAATLLNDKWRLTSDAGSPVSYDLRNT